MKLGGGVTDPYNGYEYVDMGEAGIWAKYPIGVSEWNSESLDNIKYFHWGETEGYTKSQVGIDKQFNIYDYKWGVLPNHLTKYCSDSKYGKDGFTDELTVLLPEDDACTVNMDGNWRIPTAEEFQKLISLCNKEWVTDYNGVSGLNGGLFKLKTDESKQLFFPAAGYGIDGSVYYAESSGGFHSSSLCVPEPQQEFYLGINSDNVYQCFNDDRGFGFPVVGFLGSGQ